MTTPIPSGNWWLNDKLADEDLKVTSEVARILKVSVSTLRRARKDKTLKAPSQYYQKGGYLVYLYTPEDIRELRAHFSNRIYNA